MIRLRECPHCGATAPIVKIVIYPGKDGFRDRYAVQCNYADGGCGAEGGWRHYCDEAVGIWNQRRRKMREE